MKAILAWGIDKAAPSDATRRCWKARSRRLCKGLRRVPTVLGLLAPPVVWRAIPAATDAAERGRDPLQRDTRSLA